MRKSILVVAALLTLSLSGCSGGYEPFVGITTGKNKMDYTPVEATEYNYETLSGGSVNGGCIPNTSGVDINEVGKKRWGGGDTCGGFLMPVTWKPGMTVRVSWRIYPYPDWGPGYYPQGGVNDDNYRIIMRYYENYTAVVPLPPPPPRIGTAMGKTSNLTVHFLACNQLMISYGTPEEMHDKEYIKRDFDLFRKSQKLCSRRPVVKSMADYHKYKARMDEVKKERAAIKQVILPQYMQELEAAGKLPVSGGKGQ